MSSAQLDVYRDWLGISETARPLSHYQLLALKLFEDDASVVRASYKKLNAHVRKYAAGEYGAQSQALLNELCQAMLCLTDSVRKAEYDASLGRAAAASLGRTRTFEELLVARKVVTAELLEKARRLSKTIGVDVRDAIMQQRSAPAEQVMPVYAESIGLPFVEAGDVEIDESLIPKVPTMTARQQSCAPLMVADGRVLMMAPHMLPPEIEDLLRLRFGMPVRLVLATPGHLNEVINKYYSRDAAKAELASGPSKIAAAPADGKPQKAKVPVSIYSLSPEERAALKKKRLMTSLMVCNFTGIAVIVGLSTFTSYMLQHPVLGYLGGFASGGIAFGITWLVTESKRG
ncbi:MAG TPA: hypothetical protein VG125_31655 [Pirellulales bacterium]|jgi:hypothetical protein|nr:hypothetical protein [Pirellulales bacterium]